MTIDVSSGFAVNLGGLAVSASFNGGLASAESPIDHSFLYLVLTLNLIP